MHGDDFFLSLLEIFATQAEKDIQTLNLLTVDHNWKKAAKIAHKLKGTIRTLIPSKSQSIVDLEKSLKAPLENAAIREKMDDWVEDIKPVIAWIKNEVQKGL